MRIIVYFELDSINSMMYIYCKIDTETLTLIKPHQGKLSQTCWQNKQVMGLQCTTMKQGRIKFSNFQVKLSVNFRLRNRHGGIFNLIATES